MKKATNPYSGYALLDKYLLGGDSTRASEDYNYFTTPPASPPYYGDVHYGYGGGRGGGKTITYANSSGTYTLPAASGMSYTFIGTSSTVTVTSTAGTYGSITPSSYVYWKNQEIGSPIFYEEQIEETEKFNPAILKDGSSEVSYEF